jgi:exopolysaccharide biosynthesis polyprenyl glycosylphosphotransferase
MSDTDTELPVDGLARIGHASAEVGIRTTVAGEHAPAIERQERWQRAYSVRLFLGDAAVLVAANLAAVAIRFGSGKGPLLGGVAYSEIALAVAAGWLLMLFATRAYEPRFLGIGSEEYKRVGSASLRVIAALALIDVAFKISLARGYILVAVGAGLVGLLLHRYVARRFLYRGRRAGQWLHRVLVVGSDSSAAELASELRREVVAGFAVVGACVAGAERSTLDVEGEPVPIVGGLSDIPEAAAQVGADTIAVTGSRGITPQVLRRLAWQLEGTGVDLIVAPALTNVAGPRVSIRPVAGLPLLHVEEPEITGVRYILKEVVERSFAIIVGLLALPVVLAIAAAIKATSPGPVFFKQTRVSRHGEEFCVYKFRSMYVDAEARLEALRHLNENSDGLLFKMREDPRVTPAGRWLRRYSLDELPQLWNVIRGDMALVGPRPPLPSEVANYAFDVKRRLLVKPGMTGLWQVSGRSDLSWEDTVRLDLYYVENWSLALDAQILVRTMRAVVAGHGAY